jgi:hypothetical protein
MRTPSMSKAKAYWSVTIVSLGVEPVDDELTEAVESRRCLDISKAVAISDAPEGAMRC